MYQNLSRITVAVFRKVQP